MLGAVPVLLEQGQPEVPGCTYHDPWLPPGKLRDFVELFPYHVFGDSCAPSYAPFFEAGADKISEACAAYIPQ